jgi:exopolyphosphatase/guanosine-5'-triphosphate,3'-diphosphate pyrophosphatase
VTLAELTVRIDDREVHIAVAGGGEFTLPVGPLALVEGPLEGADLPSPIQLTNALGLVHDHLDDVIIAAPSVTTVQHVVAVGVHATELACVELGSRDLPDPYELRRTDADEVFRTIALEPRNERRHNPGLDPGHVESIIGTCCVILGVMRRLDLGRIGIRAHVENAKMP